MCCLQQTNEYIMKVKLKLSAIFKALVIHVMLYYVVYMMHARLQSMYYQKCNSNIIRFYMLKDSNMCRLISTLSQVLERVVFVRMDIFIGKFHQTIQGI
jgi:hypothetical protein